MDDPMLLKQQIEFLQLELDDARSREIQTKSMYESMLKSLSAPSESSTLAEELKILKENHSQELKILEGKHRQATLAHEQKLEDLANSNTDLQETIKKLQSRHEETLNTLNYDLLKLTEEKSRTLYRLLEKENIEKNLEKATGEIARLKSTIDQQKFESNEEILKIRENCNKTLEDLRKIYENEKLGLQKIIEDQSSKLAKLTQGYLADELEEILKSTGYRLDELQNSQSLALEACVSLKSYLSSPESLPSGLVSNYSSFVKLIRSLELNEAKLRETIRQKDSQIQSLHKQDSINCEIINEKDSEILKLKKVNGDLRIEAEGTSKPPVHTPKSKHGRSRTAFQPTENSPGLHSKEIEGQDSEKPRKSERALRHSIATECEVCKDYVPSERIDEHTMACKLEYELKSFQEFMAKSPSNCSNLSGFDQRFSVEKAESIENISRMKIVIGKLKNQRDRARVAGEHLLLYLKNVKLELAVSEERACEMQMDLKKEIKALVRSLLTFRSRYALPMEAIAEIDKLVNKSSRFFGGKMNFQLED